MAAYPNKFRNLTLLSFILVFCIAGTTLLLGTHAASPSCTKTLNPGANVSSALQGAAAGSTICFNTGSYNVGSTIQEGAGVTPSSMVYLEAAPGATVHLGPLNLNFPTANLIIEGFYLDGGVQLLSSASNVVFQ